MKLFKSKLFLIIFTFPLMSCIPEIAPPASEQEIITEISRTWNCEMTEDGSFSRDFSATISNNSADLTQISISNFHDSGEVVTATVSKDLIIDIPEQTIGQQTFEGSGDISNDYSRISWEYTIVNSGGTVQVTGTYTSGTTS